MHKELSEDLNSIKNTQSEMKDTLIKLKSNLQGNNYGVDEADQINDSKHKEAKNNQSEQQEEKESKK